MIILCMPFPCIFNASDRADWTCSHKLKLMDREELNYCRINLNSYCCDIACVPNNHEQRTRSNGGCSLVLKVFWLWPPFKITNFALIYGCMYCISWRFYWELTSLLKTSGVIIRFEEDLVVILKDGACISTIIYFQDSTPGNDASCSRSFTVTRSNTALEAYVGIWGWYDDTLPQPRNLSQMAFVYV